MKKNQDSIRMITIIIHIWLAVVLLSDRIVIKIMGMGACFFLFLIALAITKGELRGYLK